MKKLMILFLVSILTISCNDGKKENEKIRYTQDSEEINTLKSVIQNYENGEWDKYKTHYADTAKLYYNSRQSQNVDQVLDDHKQSLEGLSNYEFPDEHDEYEMVVTDDDETWVNYWGDWQGTIAENDSMIEIPVHITARFVDGKIVAEHVYFDNSGMIAAYEALGVKRSMDSINKAQTN